MATRWVWTIILPLFGASVLIQCSQAFQITNDFTSSISVHQGEPYELNCGVDQKWDFCTWTHMGSGKKCRQIAGQASSTCKIDLGGTDAPRIYNYNSDDRTCTLRISDAKIQDFSSWECLLREGYQIADKIINVTVYSRTVLDFKTKPHRQLTVGQDEEVECSGVGGNPIPNILASIGPGPEIDYANDIPLQRIDQASSYDTYTNHIVMSSLFKYSPTRNHRQFYVKCISLQSDYVNNAVVDVFPNQVVSHPFDVVFAPMGPNVQPIFEVEFGREAIISIGLYANPLPTNDQVIWHFVHEHVKDTIEMMSGRRQGRYDAHFPAYLDQALVSNDNYGLFNVTLVIQDVVVHDLTTHAYLEVINDLGTSRVPFQLVLKIPKPTGRPDYADDDDDTDQNGGGMSLGLIIGIVLAVLVVGTGIGFSIWYCKAKGLLCFAPQTRYKVDVELQDKHAYNKNVQQVVSNLENGETKDLMSKSPSSGAYQPSIDEVDDNIPDTSMRNALKKHPKFKGKVDSTTAADSVNKSANQRQSYKLATGRESAPNVKWPEK